VQALEGQNLAGKVLVSGQDADLASLQLIAQGKQTMTIYKSIQPLAFGAVDAAVKLARGEKVDTTETIDNGFKKVPAILLEPVAVDRNNLLTTVVKDGYHTLAEICAGIPADKCPKE
jgi:D-xylose transport system substrate-binding protein